jgi:hypothetical protein
LEDFGKKYIPNVSDYLSEMEIKSWMANGLGEGPASQKKVKQVTEKVNRIIKID